MVLKVAVLMAPNLSRSREVAYAMSEGIKRYGDIPILCTFQAANAADVAVCYGWRESAVLKQYSQFVYADLGYWQRETHYRVAVNDWSPHRYLNFGMSAARLESFGVQIKPWKEDGQEVIVVGAKRKSMIEHGWAYRDWEASMLMQLRRLGHNPIYRPKPNDPSRTNLLQFAMDDRPADEALKNAKFIATHHSNMALDALVEGVPVYCETGAGAAFSSSIETMERLPGREQFLWDCAWLQWSVAEIRNGDCWTFLRERGLIRD